MADHPVYWRSIRSPKVMVTSYVWVMKSCCFLLCRISGKDISSSSRFFWTLRFFNVIQSCAQLNLVQQCIEFLSSSCDKYSAKGWGPEPCTGTVAFRLFVCVCVCVCALVCVSVCVFIAKCFPIKSSYINHIRNCKRYLFYFTLKMLWRGQS